MYFFVKVIVLVFIIGIIIEVVKYYSMIGGFIVVFFFVSLFSLFWILFEGGNK